MPSTKTPTPNDLTEQAAHLRLAITRTARRMRQEAGAQIGPAATAALATIERRGPLTPSELAKAERIQRPTATRLIARLEQEKLVLRASDPTDGRCSLISVTADGRALLRRLRKRKNAYLARRMRDLPSEDVATLERAAGILERVLEEERD
jgi:DNA-binding MarR family transcriptional regulator